MYVVDLLTYLLACLSCLPCLPALPLPACVPVCLCVWVSACCMYACVAACLSACVPACLLSQIQYGIGHRTQRRRGPAVLSLGGCMLRVSSTGMSGLGLGPGLARAPWLHFLHPHIPEIASKHSALSRAV
jgi:hypothetical protein